MSPAGVVELKESREAYLVLPHLANDLAGEYRFMTLYLAVNRQGVPFIWPVPSRRRPDGKTYGLRAPMRRPSTP